MNKFLQPTSPSFLGHDMANTPQPMAEISIKLMPPGPDGRSMIHLTGPDDPLVALQILQQAQSVVLSKAIAARNEAAPIQLANGDLTRSLVGG